MPQPLFTSVTRSPPLAARLTERLGEVFSAQGLEKGNYSIYRRMAMRRKNGKSPMLDLTLSLSRPQRRGGSSEVIMAEDGSQSRSSSSSSSPKTSPPSSCVSSDNEQGKYSSSPKAASMVLAGCTRCLTYVMLPEEDPKCPRCKSTVLLDFFHDITTKKNKKR